jgi:hypothetical protein
MSWKFNNMVTRALDSFIASFIEIAFKQITHQKIENPA